MKSGSPVRELTREVAMNPRKAKQLGSVSWGEQAAGRARACCNLCASVPAKHRAQPGESLLHWDGCGKLLDLQREARAEVDQSV